MQEEMRWNDKEIERRTRRAVELTQVSDLPYVWVPRKPVPPPFVPPPGWKGISDKWVPGEERAKNAPGTAAGSKRQKEHWRQPESGPQEAPGTYAHGHDRCSVFQNSSGGGPDSCSGWNGCDLYEVCFSKKMPYVGIFRTMIFGRNRVGVLSQGKGLNYSYLE